MLKQSGEYDPSIDDNVTIDDTKYSENAENTREELEKNSNTVTPVYNSIRTKRK